MERSYTFVLPLTVDEGIPNVLLGERQMIQRLVDGRLLRGIIPKWAGQYSLIGGPVTNGESPEQTAQRVFLEQTGINLRDTQLCQNLGIVEQNLLQLKDSNYNLFNVLYLFISSGKLDELKARIDTAIQNAPASGIKAGILLSVEKYSLPDAQIKIGPVLPPVDGWRQYLIRNYFDGIPPGRLNLEIDELTSKLAQRSSQDSSWFNLALNHIPEINPIPPIGIPVKTTLTLVNTTPANLWLAADIDSVADWTSTINRPDANIKPGTASAPTLPAFASITLNEEINGNSPSAKFTIAMSTSFSGDFIIFTVNQKDALGAEPRDLVVKGDLHNVWHVSQVASGDSEIPSLTLFLRT